MGGAWDCWTVQITILRSNDWNGLLPEVVPASEEPPPPDGNPHLQFGPELTAEQLYQQQVHNWLAQNGAPPADNANQGNGPPQQNAGWGDWPIPQAPPLPPLPPHLVNYQAWLATQGLTVQHGLVPEDNISDNAMEAWNDTFSSSDDSSVFAGDALLLLPLAESATPQSEA